jgi:hypothetical protein
MPFHLTKYWIQDILTVWFIEENVYGDRAMGLYESNAQNQLLEAGVKEKFVILNLTCGIINSIL